MKRPFPHTRLAIWASGTGTNALALMQYFKKNKRIAIALLITNNTKAHAIRHARRYNIPVYVIQNKALAGDCTPIIQVCQTYSIDWHVLAGFLRKIPPKICQTYARRLLNIHPALLPKYKGKGMYGIHVHKAVLKAQENYSGLSIHYVNEAYDEGSIVFQKRIPLHTVSPKTPTQLAKTIQKMEHQYYAKIIRKQIYAQKPKTLALNNTTIRQRNKPS